MPNSSVYAIIRRCLNLTLCGPCHANLDMQDSEASKNSKENELKQSFSLRLLTFLC